MINHIISYYIIADEIPINIEKVIIITSVTFIKMHEYIIDIFGNVSPIINAHIIYKHHINNIPLIRVILIGNFLNYV